ncbi:uncharacterized protein LOC105691973 [Athalia rosae]|uniref:uncharacterized protein LOC105691973 n=1 Tax=Athalia rosae TaxID=37344 RepID=UPI0020337A26|nr:uncharacterized protein LOC105691973 [Athalia rosae]
MMSSTEPSNQRDKLKEVLQLFLRPDYTTASTTYCDILLSHIAKNTVGGPCANSDIDKLVLQRWVLHALETWSTEKKPCQVVLTFTMKLIGLIGRNEYDFLYWDRENVFTKLSMALGLKEDNLQASVKMAYISMLLEFLSHTSGRRWIIKTGTWKAVVKFCHSNHTLYVTRESQKFIWKLLLCESENTEFCREVILVVAEPLIMNTFIPQKYPTMEDHYLDQNELLLTIIDLLTAIMENTLFATMDNTIPLLLESITNLESRIKALFEACISTKFFSHIIKLMFLLLFLRLKQGLKGSDEPVADEYWSHFFMNIRYIDSMLLAKKYILDIVKGRKIMLVYWKKLNNLCRIQRKDQYKIEDQCITIMMSPLFAVTSSRDATEDMLEMFAQKIFRLTCTYTQRLCYAMRDVLIKEAMPVEQIAKASVQIQLDVIDIVDKDEAVLTFQALTCILRDYVRLPKCPYQHSCASLSPTAKNCYKSETEYAKIPKINHILLDDPIVQCPTLLSTLLDGLCTIINKYKLKWQECLETICILTLAQHILSHPNVIPKLCVQALSLCKLAIQNFMTPNLALLVECDNNRDEIGPVLFKRMHDPNWEVRDSVLEVIGTIATISENKYPAFQDLLLDNGFLELIVEVAAKDGESYVRATALTCIVIFVRINRLWNEKLCHLNLTKMAIDLISNESEAIVRREAVNLVKELYVHRKWPKSTEDEMAKAMSVAAVLDLHWEVKVNALQFWFQFITARFSDQGMLDGHFPTVTFSKEHRKIVALDESEIQKRILKVLDELANQNCLGILLAALEDDSDFQVCKASAEILRKLKEIFVKYKLDDSSCDDQIINEMIPSAEDRSVVSNHNETLASQNDNPMIADIIDSIADADDMNLLASVYKNTMNVSENAKTPTGADKLVYISTVQKSQFLRSVFSCDIDAYMEEKNRWLKTYTNSLGSVVDDILVAHDKNNVNEMDCY